MHAIVTLRSTTGEMISLIARSIAAGTILNIETVLYAEENIWKKIYALLTKAIARTVTAVAAGQELPALDS